MGHLIFTDVNGDELPDSSQAQARRSKAKRFFNKDWKELMQTAMYFFSGASDYIFYTNCCESNAFYLSKIPEIFTSHNGYLEPRKIMLEEDDYDE